MLSSFFASAELVMVVAGDGLKTYNCYLYFQMSMCCVQSLELYHITAYALVQHELYAYFETYNAYPFDESHFVIWTDSTTDSTTKWCAATTVISISCCGWLTLNVQSRYFCIPSFKTF